LSRLAGARLNGSEAGSPLAKSRAFFARDLLNKQRIPMLQKIFLQHRRFSISTP